VTQPIQNGYLLIADISGFTSFIADTELDHAQAIIRQVLDGLLRNLTPTMKFCEVEGDAVFVYGLAEQVSRGELIAELIESTYAGFRDQQRTMIRNATCPCQACRAISGLDLKFVVHYGEFVLQELAGKTGPVGSSVNLVHALLKNRVGEQTGWQGYALYTAQALAQMGLPPDGMHRNAEHREHLGTFATYSTDLNARYETLCETRRIFIDKQDAHFEVVRDVGAARPVVWDWLNDTDKRTRWTMHTAWSAVTRPGGRTGPNASNHCATYNAIEYILDWRPFDYYTVRITRHGLDLLITVSLEELEDGTRMRWRMKVELPLPRWLLEKMAGLMESRQLRLQVKFDEMERLIAEERRGRSSLPESAQP
jgi:hypothetical protein